MKSVAKRIGGKALEKENILLPVVRECTARTENKSVSLDRWDLREPGAAQGRYRKNKALDPATSSLENLSSIFDDQSVLFDPFAISVQTKILFSLNTRRSLTIFRSGIQSRSSACLFYLPILCLSFSKFFYSLLLILF